MNIEHLRKSLRAKWLSYYRENRNWLTRLGVWVNCEGQRRPSSSFILATLSILEPQLTQVLPLVVDLSSNPDRIIMALGLNFNPDEILETEPIEPAVEEVRMLPAVQHVVAPAPVPLALESQPIAQQLIVQGRQQIQGVAQKLPNRSPIAKADVAKPSFSIDRPSRRPGMDTGELKARQQPRGVEADSQDSAL